MECIKRKRNSVNKILDKKLNPSEHAIQCAIVEWAQIAKFKSANPILSSCRIGDFLFAIPNGGKRNITEAVRLKKEGVKRGVSDLFLSIPNGDNHGLWIEVKTKKGKLSCYQCDWFEKMQILGYPGYIARSSEEGIQAIKEYLGMR